MSSPSPIRNETQNVQFKVVLVISPNGTYNQPDPALETAELALLGILFFVSLCVNTFLLVTILSSYTLRGESFNILLANLSFTFLVETTVNMSIALLCMATDTWHIGDVGCAISSFAVQTVTMEITFGLSMMSLQSMILMRNPYEFQSFWTLKKQAVAIAAFWVAGILLCLPLLLESIQSQVFMARYGCAFSGYDGFVYMVSITVWCYGIMIIIGIGCLINIAVQQYKEYRAQARKHGNNFSEVFIPGGLWTEWINVKLVAWLTLFYLLMEFPYIMMHHVTGLRYDFATYTSNTSLKYETVLTWFRYLYSVFFACLVFKIRKDIRYKFRNLLPCCRPNVVRDQSPLPTIKPEPKKEKQRKDSIPPISLSTPVLYISPEGLCLRQLAPPTKSFLNYAQNDKTKKPPNFISYLCDVEPVSVTEGFTGSLEDSFSSLSRRDSKEMSELTELSEMSLTVFNSGDASKNMSQDIPLKDMDPIVSQFSPQSESPIESKSPQEFTELSPRKKVRFADTVTFYQSATPEVETPTPGWVTTKSDSPKVESDLKSRHSKIPMLVQPPKIPLRVQPPKIPMRVQPTNSAPWKVEMNRTYNVKSPSSWQVNKPVARNTKNYRKEDLGPPIHWRIYD